MKNEKSNRFNSAKVIFDTIVENLKTNNAIWLKPWVDNEVPCNAVSKRAYNGYNAFMLNFISSIKGWKTNRFMTFKQVSTMGGKVRKGEKANMIVFSELKNAYAYDENGKVVKGENGKPMFDATRRFFLSRYYYVFNIDQCEGLPASMYEKEGFNTKRVKTADMIIAEYEDCPSIQHGGDIACYVPSLDIIKMPNIENFMNESGYYSTLFHECVHSTGAKKRLNRSLETNKGTEKYAIEELIAEIGATILLNDCGMELPIENHTAYCKSWLKAITNMKETALMGAFNKAWKATEYIHGTTAQSEKVA